MSVNLCKEGNPVTAQHPVKSVTIHGLTAWQMTHLSVMGHSFY